MSQIDQRYSPLGLLTYQFELKFKKVLLFLEIVDDPELLYYISSYLEIEELLAMLSTCKKLNALKSSPMIEVRILRQKIKHLQSPKQIFNSLILLPAYHQLMNHPKQEQKQIPKNAQIFFKNIKQYKSNLEKLKKNKQLAIQSRRQGKQVIQSRKQYDTILQNLEKQVFQEIKMPKPQSPKLSKQAPKPQKTKSYVQKFRQDYVKAKQFEKKKNISKLQQIHQQERQKIRVVKTIQTPFKTIPVIEIRDDEKIHVTKAQPFYQTATNKFLNRVKTVFGFSISFK